MAGDWIKWVKGLQDKPEVVRMAGALGLQREVVVCRLMRFWEWCDENIADDLIHENGSAFLDLSPNDGDNVAFVDAVVGTPQFAKSLALVGWIRFRSGRIEIPNFGRHNGETAKTRARNSKNQKTRRTRESGSKDGQPPKMSPRAGDISVTRGDKRIPPPPPPRARRGKAGKGRDGEHPDWPALRDSWNAGTGTPWRPAKPPDLASARLDEPGWLDEAVAAIEHLPRCRYFRTPVTLLQLVSSPTFARDIVGGKYDDVLPAKHGPPGFEARQPPSASELEARRRRQEEQDRKNREMEAEKQRRARLSPEERQREIDEFRGLCKEVRSRIHSVVAVGDVAGTLQAVREAS
jgi:hypothetical protein